MGTKNNKKNTKSVPMWGWGLGSYPGSYMGNHDWSSSHIGTAGQRVGVDNLLTQASVYQAVYVLSSGVASVDFRVVEYLPQGGMKVDYEHPFYELIAVEPNPDISARSMRESIMIHLLTTGNAYVEIERNYYGEPINLWLLPPTLVQPQRDYNTGKLVYWVPGRDTYLDSADVVHIAAPGYDGLMGLSPIHHLRNLVGVSMALDEFAASYFSNGCNIKGILKAPTDLTPEAQENLRSSFEKVHAGGSNANRLLVLEEGMEFQPTSATPNESQMSETQKLQMLKIAMAFNLPPTKVGLYDHTALNTLEESNLDFFNSSLLPWVDRIEQAFNRKLFSRADRKKWGVLHDESAPIKGRMKERVEVWTQLKNLGVITTNDIRAELGMPPVEYGDVTLVAANNLAPIEQVVNGVSPALGSNTPAPAQTTTEDQQ